MHLIDTHTHLTMPEYADSLPAVLARARQVGVRQCIAVGTDLPDSRAALQLCTQHEGLFCIVGVHPHQAAHAEPGYLAELAQLAQQPPVCAVGEIGLDYHYDFSPPDRQRAVFTELLDLAARLDKPVVIHCREALDEGLAILAEWNRPAAKVVFHCFSGDRAQARRVLDAGCSLSFTGVLTFAKADALRQAAAYAPLDRILLETDCPYLSPEPKRAVRPNEPAFLTYVAEKLAQLRAQNAEEIADATTANAQAFFALHRPRTAAQPPDRRGA